MKSLQNLLRAPVRRFRFEKNFLNVRTWTSAAVNNQNIGNAAIHDCDRGITARGSHSLTRFSADALLSRRSREPAASRVSPDRHPSDRLIVFAFLLPSRAVKRIPTISERALLIWSESCHPVHLVYRGYPHHLVAQRC